MRKPDVTIPDTTPPSDLLIEDETIGEGDEAAARHAFEQPGDQSRLCERACP